MPARTGNQVRKMIPFEKALSLVLRHTKVLPAECVEIRRSAGAVLAKPLRARWGLPRFDQSAVDGFAVRSVDVAEADSSRRVRLKLEGEVRAGERPPPGRLRPGTAVKIFTGAPIPPGTDAVVMKEFCRESKGAVLIGRAVRSGENIRRKGEEAKRGAVLLEAGCIVTPPVAGLLAGFGISEVTVHRRPEVSILATGDELAAPGEPLARGRIYDSNSPALEAAVLALGFPVVSVGRVRDRLGDLERALKQAFEKSDVVLTAGGVSVGEYDFVRTAASRLGVRTIFWRVAMKPGKPNFFGVGSRRRRRVYLFGLPGNPVAVLVSFHQFVKPALFKLSGRPESVPAKVQAELTETIRKKVGRLEWVRGRLSGPPEALTVTPTRGQGSHMLSGLSTADCLIEFPAEASECKAGDTVRVVPLRWTW